MFLITEIVEDVKCVISESKESGKKDMFIEGIFLQGAIKNKNGRVYPVNILENEVARYRDAYITKNRALGELGHPSSPTINLDRVSHKILELRREGTDFYGKAKIMDTPMGNIVKSLINDGVTVGVSSRGMGSLKLNREGINEVQSDFHLSTAADIVADPSAPNAFVNGIMEGVEWFWINERLVAKEIKPAIERAVASRELETQKLSIFENFLINHSKS